jgi:diamine N-acetyltransferase
MDVSLRSIDETNRPKCIALHVTQAQEKLIAPNWKSLEWADANSRCVPLAIFADDELVGFAMFEPRGNDVFSVHRFMIDASHQRQGIGSRAMQLLMEKIWALGGKTIYLSFRPENIGAKSLYEKLGFRLHEVESNGEIIYRFGDIRQFNTNPIF